MELIRAQNVNDAYLHGMVRLNLKHEHRHSRNGPVLVCPEPVTTHYEQPCQRVLFLPGRDANPFFHLFEALWMLTGANDVAVPAYFVPRMREYSDDGETFHGAYGFRWRHANPLWKLGRWTGRWTEGHDQLNDIVTILQADQTDRRAVLTMWSTDADLASGSKDIPCNTQIKFDIRDGRLCMVVFNRSNDIIWGCYGANAVHLSILQEYLAARIGVPVGWYEQVSTDFHAYQSAWDQHWPVVEIRLQQLKDTDEYPNEYDTEIEGNPPGQRIVCTMPLVQNTETFDEECLLVVEGVRGGVYQNANSSFFTNSFFHVVALPMYQAYRLYRRGDSVEAVALLDQAIEQTMPVDWLVAARMWMMRRATKRNKDYVTTPQGEQA